MIVGFNWRHGNIKITQGERTKDELKNILINWQRKYIGRSDIMSKKKKIKILQKGKKKKKEKKRKKES